MWPLWGNSAHHSYVEWRCFFYYSLQAGIVTVAASQRHRKCPDTDGRHGHGKILSNRKKKKSCVVDGIVVVVLRQLTSSETVLPVKQRKFHCNHGDRLSVWKKTNKHVCQRLKLKFLYCRLSDETTYWAPFQSPSFKNKFDHTFCHVWKRRCLT